MLLHYSLLSRPITQYRLGINLRFRQSSFYKIFGLTIMLIIILPSVVWATSYYVDDLNGNNVNSGTELQPVKTISKAVEKANPGDVVWIASGTYRETINFPKSGSGASQTIALRAMSGANVQIKGSDLVSGWTLHAGAIWKKTGWSINSQQVFVNGTPLQQIGSSCPYNTIAWGASSILPPIGTGISSLVPGSFFYDQATQTLYVYLIDGSDPNSHQLEASTRNWIISTDQNFIELNSLQFSHSNVTSIPFSLGMVNISGQGWLVANCSFTYSDFAGLSISGTGHQVIRNVANFNGNVGISINGSDAAHNWDRYPNRPPQDILLDGNETSSNNYRKFDTSWQAGGIKAAVSCNGVTISRHYAESNTGAGIWFDSYSTNARIEQSIVINNLLGIAYEISDNAVIANNLVVQNNSSGIFIAASSGVSIFNNTVVQNGYSIVLHGMPREEHPALQNNTIRNNIISQSKTGDLIIYHHPSVATGNTSDYNLFNGDLRITYTPDSGYYPNYTNLSDFARDTGQEIHSLIASPGFKNPATKNYQIIAGSPAIDAGTNQIQGIGNKDLLGNTRIVDGRKTGEPVIDIGAYEYGEDTKPLTPAGLRVVK